MYTEKITWVECVCVSVCLSKMCARDTYNLTNAHLASQTQTINIVFMCVRVCVCVCTCARACVSSFILT